MEKTIAELPISKKAFRVWNPEDFDYPHPDNGDIVYAESAGQAKSQYRSFDFTKVKVQRKKEQDKVIVDGQEMNREYAEYFLKQKARAEKMALLSDDDMYYVQDARTYTGNSVVWWAQDSNGYTSNIDLAHKFTKAEIVKDFSKGRDTDIIWPASHVEKNIKRHVDVQYLNSELKV